MSGRDSPTDRDHDPGLRIYDAAAHILFVTNSYNANQPRQTKGTPTAGRWVTDPKTEGRNAAAIGVTSSAAPAPLPETRRLRRGHDFYPKNFSDWPATRTTDGIPTPAKEVLAHYFSPNADWYIVEADQDGYAFGYTKLANNPDGEWGYIDLTALEKLGEGKPLYCVERDLYPVGTLIRHMVDEYSDGLGPVERLDHSAKEAETVEDLADMRRDIRSSLYGLEDTGYTAFGDRLADSILDGQLSRGVAGKAGAEAITAWRVHAAQLASTTPQARDFKTGVEKAIVHLYASKFPDLGALPNGGVELENFARRATELAKTKRASLDDRQEWRHALQHASSKAEWNGMLVAGAALSGTDSWWGFRDNPLKTITRRSDQ